MITEKNKTLAELEESLNAKRAEVKRAENRYKKLKEINPGADPCLQSKINRAKLELKEKEKRLLYFERQYNEFKYNQLESLNITLRVSYDQLERIQGMAKRLKITTKEVILKGLELMEKESNGKRGTNGRKGNEETNKRRSDRP